MVEYLSGNRIQGSSTLASSPPQTSWKELDRVTLTSAGDTLDTGTFTAKDNIMILEHKIPTGNCRSKYQFNADDDDNYAQRYNDNGGTDGTITSDPVIYAYHSGGTAKSFSVHSIINNSSQEKLLIGNIVENGGDGSGNAPNRQELVGKWANTSAQINRVKLFNDGTGDFDTDSEIVVLGCDNDEADSGTNFWQELDSVELSGTSDTLSSGTFTAKKYLWVQAYTTIGSGTPEFRMKFNGDVSSNYANRYFQNDGNDSTGVNVATGINGVSAIPKNTLVNMFIINKSDEEKLLIMSAVNQNTAGAGNATSREKCVGKFANTSSQITSIQISSGSGDWGSGSSLKVWGSD